MCVCTCKPNQVFLYLSVILYVNSLLLKKFSLLSNSTTLANTLILAALSGWSNNPFLEKGRIMSWPGWSNNLFQEKRGMSWPGCCMLPLLITVSFHSMQPSTLEDFLVNSKVLFWLISYIFLFFFSSVDIFLMSLLAQKMIITHKNSISHSQPS